VRSLPGAAIFRGVTTTAIPRPGSPLSARYDVERELGAGGMATVYLAEEKKHGRKVAIKVLRPELAASVGAERFLREIGIVARLSHPHLVPLIDSGDSDGLLYYVSPFVPGGSLRDRLRDETRLPVRDVLRIASEVGAGLDYAHRAGFIHRDVKPENILFADGHAMLADFGVARAMCVDCDPHTESGPVTAAGIALGTPEYMSPEQASGDRDADARSDIYSLACVVYEMLAGQPPFKGSARSTMVRHVTETPRPIRTLRPDAPPVVEAVLARALAKDPAHRYGTVAEFTTALCDDVSVVPTVDSARSIAVLPFVNASPDPENEYLSDGITDELIDALAKLEGLRVASRTSVFSLKNKAQDVRAIGALLGVSVVLEGTVRRLGPHLRVTAQLTSTDDGRLLWSQRYDRELADVFALQDEIAQTIVATLRAKSFGEVPSRRQRRYTENMAAYALYLRGRHAWNKRTNEGVSEAIQFFEQAIAADPNYALAYTGLSDAYALHVDYRSVPVHEGFARAREYAELALGIDETLAEAHTSLGWVLFIYEWQWAEAARQLKRAIELDHRYATAHQWYAALLAARGEMQEALIEGHTAQDLDPNSASVRRSLGYMYFYARRYSRARYHAKRALTLAPNAVETFRVLGLILTMEGKFREAEEVLRDALALPGAGSYTMATLGYALGRAGRGREARDILEQLDVQRREHYVSPVALATVCLGIGDYEEALTWAERACDERRGWLAYMDVNPILDPLRGKPRFEQLRRRMGL